MKAGYHRLWAVASTPAAAAVAAPLVGVLPPWKLAVSSLIAAVTSTAADLDNTPLFRKIDKRTPDEALGGSGPLGHRQLSHWWGVPVGLGWLVTKVDTGVVGWVLLAALWGYLSHIILDAPFGEEGMGTKQGVPLFLWYGRVGGWFYSDRLGAKLAIWPLCVLALWAGVGFPFHDHLPAVWLVWLGTAAAWFARVQAMT